ncbi:MAG: class I tRNA ligase family protein [Candidatus Hodgkinia cicadicola]
MYSRKTRGPIATKASLQWFVKLAVLTPACNRLVGLQIWPRKWRLIAASWVDNLSLWCVSRSIAWGHRLPVWWIGKEFVVRDTYLKALYYWVLRTGVFGRPASSLLRGLKQGLLVLDAWFSSALWRLFGVCRV